MAKKPSNMRTTVKMKATVKNLAVLKRKVKAIERLINEVNKTEMTFSLKRSK